MNVRSELNEIRKLLGQATLISAVRREVQKVAGARRVIVRDGKSSGKNDYEVVISNCGDVAGCLARRLRSSMDQVQVDEIVEGVLGIRKQRKLKARRGRKK